MRTVRYMYVVKVANFSYLIILHMVRHVHMPVHTYIAAPLVKMV